MNIQKESSHNGVTVYIDPFYDGKYNRRYITVYKHKSWNIKSLGWKPATINWSCIGETEPKKAEQFAEAMKKAVEIADMLDTEIWKLTGIDEKAKDPHKIYELYFDCKEEGKKWFQKAEEMGHQVHLEPIILG